MADREHATEINAIQASQLEHDDIEQLVIAQTADWVPRAVPGPAAALLSATRGINKNGGSQRMAFQV